MRDWLDDDARWSGIREDVVTVRGHLVRVLRTDDHRPGGTRHLLVHGLGGSAANWLDVMVSLSRHGPVVAVDLPGFGGTSVPADGSARIAGNAAFVVALTDALGWDTYALYGNSMGGLIAALVAGEHPAQVDRLVLVSPALPPASLLRILPLPRMALGLLPMAIPLVGPAIVQGVLAGAARGGLSGDVSGSLAHILPDPSVIRSSMRRAMAAEAELAELRPTAVRAGSMTAATQSLVGLWIRSGRVRRALDAIIAPTLLLGGELDPLIPARLLRDLAGRRQDWTSWIAPGVGHVMMLEAPDLFMREVEHWYAGLTSSPPPTALASTPGAAPRRGTDQLAGAIG